MIKKLAISFLVGAGVLALLFAGGWLLVYSVPRLIDSSSRIMDCAIQPQFPDFVTCEASTLDYVVCIGPGLLAFWLAAYSALYISAEEKSDDR